MSEQDQDNAYINKDGSVKQEILEQQQADLASSANRHNVDPELVDKLLSEVNEQGYVIIHDLIDQETITKIHNIESCISEFYK